MEWTDFILYLTGGYLIYYGILVGLDLLKARRGVGVLVEENMLEFPEETETTIIEDREGTIQMQASSPALDEGLEDDPRQGENPAYLPLYGENVNVSTGGVYRMMDLFRLAQDETIEFKKNLVY